MSTMGVVVSVTDFTTAAGWMAGLAIAALDLRRLAQECQSDRREHHAPNRKFVGHGFRSESPRPPCRSTRARIRCAGVWAAFASAGLGIVIGIVTAIIIAFGSAYAVVTLTDLLKS